MTTQDVASSGERYTEGQPGEAPGGVVILEAVPGAALTIPHGTLLLVAGYAAQEGEQNTVTLLIDTDITANVTPPS